MCCGHCKSPSGSIFLASSSQPALTSCLLVCHVSYSLPVPLAVPQLLRMFFRQQDEIRRLKEELAQKDIRLRQLQLELKNLRNNPKNC